jgi:hypothetical protein
MFTFSVIGGDEMGDKKIEVNSSSAQFWLRKKGDRNE